jgi:hypothetical protein
MLQPLATAIATAHTEVIATAALIGSPGMSLSPLDQLGESTHNYCL